MHLGCSSWTWTGIWDDVRNPLSDAISNSVLGRSNSVFPWHNSLRVFCQGKTEFDLPKTEFEMASLRGFLTSSEILVHVQLLHPRCITDSQKGYIIAAETKELKYINNFKFQKGIWKKVHLLWLRLWKVSSRFNRRVNYCWLQIKPYLNKYIQK